MAPQDVVEFVKYWKEVEQDKGKYSFIRKHIAGQPGWLSGLALPSAQGVILGTQDQVPHWVPRREPASPSACVFASLCISHK